MSGSTVSTRDRELEAADEDLRALFAERARAMAADVPSLADVLAAARAPEGDAVAARAAEGDDAPHAPPHRVGRAALVVAAAVAMAAAFALVCGAAAARWSAAGAGASVETESADFDGGAVRSAAREADEALACEPEDDGASCVVLATYMASADDQCASFDPATASGEACRVAPAPLMSQ